MNFKNLKIRKGFEFCGRLLDRHALPIFLLILLGFVLILIIFVGLHSPPWGDEEPHVKTVRHFGNNFSLNTFLDYDQIIAPLTFILYALWGKVTSFELAHLRYFSLLNATLALTLIFFLYKALLPKPRLAILGICLLLLNPYLWGLSLFVFTDVPALLLMVTAAWAILKQKPILLFISMAAALLSRQYAVYLLTASGLYYLIKLFKEGKQQIIYLIALALSAVPLLILCIIWQGIAPPSGMEKWVARGGKAEAYHLAYNFHAITTYITFMTIYLLPAFVIVWKQLVMKRSLLWISFLLSSFYLLFPVKAAEVVLLWTPYEDVGRAHRFLREVLQVPWLEHLVLWLLFYCGIVLLANIITNDVKSFRQGVWGYSHFLTLAILCFVFIMPLSVHLWEKYLVMILPFLLLRIMLLKYRPANQFF